MECANTNKLFCIKKNCYHQLHGVNSLLNTCSVLLLQINDLNQVPVPVMLLPDDFKANTKIKVNNHLFNKYDTQIT